MLYLFPLSPSHLFSPPLSCVSNTTTLLHQTQTVTQSCLPAFYLRSSSLPLSFSMGLWNCQSAVNKADLIPAIASQTALGILGLTETWIRPEDSATPAALSNNLSFSHTPIKLGRVEVLVFSFLTIGNT